MPVSVVAVLCVLSVAARRVAGQDVTSPLVTSCGTRFTDTASSSLLADIVLQGTVNQLRQASPLAPHLYRATVSVHKVYKGQALLPGSRTSASNVTVERFGPEENGENCVARAVTGQSYVFFLRLKDDQQAPARPGSPSPAGPASDSHAEPQDASHTTLLLTAMPHDLDLTVLRDVKRVLCLGCAARPVIKKLLCKNCAVAPSMRRKMTADDTKLVKPGKRLTLRCVARGVPKPAYTWYKDGQRLGDPTVHADVESSAEEGPAVVYRAGGLSVRTSRRHSLLVIKSVAPSDQGVYQCVAANAIGESQQTVKVVIPGSQPGDTRTAPDVTSGQASNAVASNVGSEACSGNPCYHGGTCYTESDGGARCECTEDYHGRRCQFRRRRTEPDLAQEGEVTEDQGSEVILGEGSDGQDKEHDQVLERSDTTVPSSSETDLDEETTDFDTTNETDTRLGPPTPSPDQPPGAPDAGLSEKERRKHLTSDRGRYEADVTQSGPDAKLSKSGVPKLKVTECPDKDYCQNGGQCKIVVKIQRRFCECPREYAGRQCERRIV